MFGTGHSPSDEIITRWDLHQQFVVILLDSQLDPPSILMNDNGAGLLGQLMLQSLIGISRRLEPGTDKEILSFY